MKSPIIDHFDGVDSYRFLSNFEPCMVPYKGLVYRSSEAAYQAAKLEDNNLRFLFCSMSASESKKAGAKVALRRNWDLIKVSVMTEIVWSKFSHNPYLIDKLLATDISLLVEGNTWKDVWWGVCKGEGMNWLGLILMQTRNGLKVAKKQDAELEKVIKEKKLEKTAESAFSAGWRLGVSGYYIGSTFTNPWCPENGFAQNTIYPNSYDWVEGFRCGQNQVLERVK